MNISITITPSERDAFLLSKGHPVTYLEEVRFVKVHHNELEEQPHRRAVVYVSGAPVSAELFFRELIENNLKNLLLR